ncbi:MAG: methyltransferase domain-containing protein [Planctomycetota bacterium]
MRAADRRDNADHLAAQFARRLEALTPTSVLDVGCGSGDLLSQCAAAGIPASGIEPHRPTAEAARERGLPVVCAPAEALPFADRTWGWVTMRHVPHHLAEPAQAVTEALRVGRSGLLAAEPWFDPEVPSQRVAELADRWLKRQHRRAGQVHGEVLDIAALMGLVPADGGFDLDFDIVLRLRRRPLEDLVAEAEPWLEPLAADSADRRAWADLLDRAARDGLSWNGTVIVTIRRS